MKKILTILALSLVCALCAVGFAACENGGEGNVPNTPAHSHTYTETLVPPTCTEQGYTLHKCECGDEYKDNYTTALGHDFGEWIETAASTCTTAGEEMRICARDNTHIEIRAINALGHTPANMVEENYVALDCTTNGSYDSVVYCTICGEEISRENNIVPAKGHNYVDSECTVCGDLQITSDSYFNFTKISGNNYEISAQSSNLPTKIILPSTHEGKPVTSIGIEAFYDCDNLINVIIPDSIKSIGDTAFSHCNNLSSVVIGSGVKSIGSSAFDECNKFTKIYYTGKISQWASQIDGLGNLMSSDRNLYIDNQLVKNVALDSITEIKSYAFAYCTSLQSVTMSTNITKIGNEVFSGCSALTSIVIPSSIKWIGYRAFYQCSNLTSAIFRNTIGWVVGTNAQVLSVYGSSVASSLSSMDIISSSDLSDDYIAAEYLTSKDSSKYSGYYWKREG